MKTLNFASKSAKNGSRIAGPLTSRRGWGLSILLATGLLFKLSAPQAAAQPYSIWNDSALPAIIEAADSGSVELGLKFRSSVNGNITGIRFYKAAGNTGTHVGNVWNTNGTLLGSVEFTSETASGWQQQAMPPVAIEANTTYIVSYHAPNGGYSLDFGYFASSGVDNSPLRALADGEDGPNGVYAYGTGDIFPNQSFNSANYWVDVVFVEELTQDTTPPQVSSVSPVNAASSVSLSSAVTVNFNEAMDSATININTIQLRDPLDTLVPASVSYNPSLLRATLVPDNPLDVGTTYTATVKGGESGVKDTSTNALTSDYTWTFTTTDQTETAASLWSDTDLPAINTANDTGAVALGLKFRSAVEGHVTGIRYYRGTNNPGPHVGRLWAEDGTPLASVVFEGESSSGWQEQALMSPVAIAADTTYVVSYHAPGGGYSATPGYFADGGYTNGPLRALGSVEAGGNGVAAYGDSSVFPNQTFGSANYWVDVVFEPESVTPGCEGDTNPPVLVVPRDVLLKCEVCDTDPGKTGVATATDECTFTITYEDTVLGDCPKVVKRIWIATDANGNCSRGVQIIACLPPAFVTDSGGCMLDRSQWPGESDFRLIFHKDPQNAPCFRLTASNPGQFLFNVFHVGNPGESVTLNLTVPYPFVTQGARPVHAYDGVTANAGDSGVCLTPGKELYAGSQRVTLASYGTAPNPSTTLPVSLKIPASGVLYVTVHLDFGLKRTTGYQTNGVGDALDCATGTKAVVPNHNEYVFSVGGAFTGSASIKNYNEFKQNSGGIKLENPHFKKTVSLAAVEESSQSPVQFGFTVTGPEEQVFIIEKCTNLSAPVWTPIATNVISGGTFDFSDLRRDDTPNCYYRIRTP
ncbi:MAG TPA: DUF4082 domain-containing protein [Verrucomicrobiota bacterium]|nr:DUF4082 domain-containing protein [Verrucomicrobiota bacterium]